MLIYKKSKIKSLFIWEFDNEYSKRCSYEAGGCPGLLQYTNGDVENVHKIRSSNDLSISRLDKTSTKMADLNRVSEQKFKRVSKSYENATDMLKKMQADLWYIHSTIKKLNQLSSADQAAVVNLFEIVVFSAYRIKQRQS